MAKAVKGKQAQKSVEAIMTERRNRVVELLREKKSYREIMKVVGVSIATVKTDVDAIFQEWRDLRVTNTEDVIMSEVATITWAIKEAMEQWELSKERKITETKYDTKSIDKTGKIKKGAVPVEIKVKTHYPERQYLETVLKSGERLAKLFGTDVPVKQEIDFNVRKQIDEEFDENPEKLYSEAMKVLEERNGKNDICKG